MTDESLTEAAKKKLEQFKAQAVDSAKTVAEVTAEVLKDQAKEAVIEKALNASSHGAMLHGVIEALGQSLNATPELKQQIGELANHISIVAPVVTEVAIKEAFKNDGAKEHVQFEMLKLTTTDNEKTEIAAKNARDDKEYKALDDKLKALQEKFDQRHPNADSPETQKLQEDLNKKFEEIRRLQVLKLQEERMKASDGRGR